MAPPDEPRNESANSSPSDAPCDTVNLVDLFDQLDRQAFTKALKLRDKVYPLYLNR